MKKVLVSLISSSILFACSPASEPNKEHHLQEGANHHMNQRSFEELVQAFEDTSRVKWQKPEAVINKFGNIKDQTIADLGAGTGYFSFLLANRGARVLALDIVERFLNYIEQKKVKLDRLLISTRKVPTDNPLLKKEQLDGLLCVDTYHHIQNRTDYFRKVFKGLKPGGKIVIVDFKKEETPHGPPINMRLTGMEVLKELQYVGFSKIIIDTYTLPYQYIVTATRTKVTKQQLSDTK